MAEWLAEDAYEVFKQKRAELEAGGDLNEATTRLRVIDTLLFEVLRWDKLEVSAEHYAPAEGFADYYMPSASTVVEAKKEGVYFVLPDKKFPQEPIPFGLLAKESTDAAGALSQAQTYAQNFGARYSAITNGRQWLLAMTFVTNQRLAERSVFVFESIQAIDDKFRTFFETFSPAALRTNLPSQRLLDARRAPAPPKLSTTIVGYPVPADRNKLINTLRPVLQLIWDEMSADPDNLIFLEHCYINPEPSEDMLRVAKELLEGRAVTDASIAAASEHADAKKLLANLESAEREHPVVILGRIGHGKSTFLRYLRRVVAKDILQKSYIQLDLDFLDFAATPDEVRGFVLDEVERQLKESYKIDIYSDAVVRQALRSNLKDFRGSPRGVLLQSDEKAFKLAELEYIEIFTKDRYRYLAALMRHLRRGQRKSVVIFFDNLDRQKDPIQEQAFLHASTIAREWSALVFVCLRPSTMQRSQAKGVLDTIAPRMLLISAPKTSTVLRKRFQYAEKFARRALPTEAYIRTAFSREIEESLPIAGDFFATCDQSIHEDPDLAEQYTAVANGNIRLVIKYVRETLTSNHLNTEKIVGIIKETGRYNLAEHETLRALIYGQYIHYDPNTSVFPNLFEIIHKDPTEHFSRLLLLDYCHRHANSVDRYGFIPLEKIRSYMTILGYSASHVQEIVAALFAKRCIEGRDFDDEAPELGDEIRVTSLGSYQVAHLVRGFVYIDAVVVDTPILEDKARSRIRDVQPIRQRLGRGRDFVAYLDRCAEALTDGEARRVWSDIAAAIVNDITDIENAVQRGNASNS